MHHIQNYGGENQENRKEWGIIQRETTPTHILLLQQQQLLLLLLRNSKLSNKQWDYSKATTTQKVQGQGRTSLVPSSFSPRQAIDVMLFHNRRSCPRTVRRSLSVQSEMSDYRPRSSRHWTLVDLSDWTPSRHVGPSTVESVFTARCT